MAKFVLAGLGLGAGAALAQQNLCVADFGNSSFNIEPLVGQEAYAVMDASNNQASRNYTYVFNFCKNVDPSDFILAGYPQCNSTVPGNGPYQAYTQTGPALAFQVAQFNAGADSCHRLGAAASPATISYGLIDPTNPSRGMYVQYGGGDLCPPLLQVARSLRVWIPCQPDAYNRPKNELVQETSMCNYEIWLNSAYGCPVQCPVVQSDGGKVALCAGHGICEFDADLGNSKCFCNDGYGGAACDQRTGGAKGLSPVGGVLVAVCVFLATTLGFLGYLWMRIRSLRLDPAAYSALRSGPGDESVN